MKESKYGTVHYLSGGIIRSLAWELRILIRQHAERQENWLAEENKTYTDKIYHPSSHGHSLYFNTLAEQGITGFSVIFLNLFYICYLLYRHTPKREDPPIYWLLWLSAAGVMQVVLINGIFTTTLHHEHGLLSVLIIGLWWSRIKEPLIEQHE